MIRRNIEPLMLAGLADSPVVLLVGGRQTGKSTLIQSPAVQKAKRRYMTFDDTNNLAAAKADPAGFLNAFSEPLTLDEIQRVPELFLAIKASVDRNRAPGRYLLSGSANVLFLPRVADSLAGRMEVLTLWPFSQGEIEGVREGFIDAVFSPKLPALKTLEKWDERKEVRRRALIGGFPEVLARAQAERRNAWFASYLTTILQRDVRDLSRIEDLAVMPRLLAILAARAGSLLNTADISRSSGTTQTTLKRYLSLLETLFLFLELPAWSINVGKRYVKMPKAFLSDTGLASHLLHLTEERLIQEPALCGALLENFAGMELRKQAAWSKEQPQLFHLRTHGQQEVDLVLEAGGRLVGIEVKAGTAVTMADFKGLRALADDAGKQWVRGIVLYSGSELLPFGDHFVAMPFSALWRLG
ncbi:MAG TPA: ATP-binding protein [Verrucomicrobiae bacterium]